MVGNFIFNFFSILFTFIIVPYGLSLILIFERNGIKYFVDKLFNFAIFFPNSNFEIPIEEPKLNVP